jgi:hypothetical protein
MFNGNVFSHLGNVKSWRIDSEDYLELVTDEPTPEEPLQEMLHDIREDYLQLVHDEPTPEELAEFMDKIKVKQDKQYMVYIVGQNPPKVVHDNQLDATNELERLLNKSCNYGKSGMVLEIIKEAKSVMTIEWSN